MPENNTISCSFSFAPVFKPQPESSFLGSKTLKAIPSTSSAIKIKTSLCQILSCKRPNTKINTTQEIQLMHHQPQSPAWQEPSMLSKWRCLHFIGVEVKHKTSLDTKIHSLHYLYTKYISISSQPFVFPESKIMLTKKKTPLCIPLLPTENVLKYNFLNPKQGSPKQ